MFSWYLMLCFSPVTVTPLFLSFRVRFFHCVHVVSSWPFLLVLLFPTCMKWWSFFFPTFFLWFLFLLWLLFPFLYTPSWILMSQCELNVYFSLSSTVIPVCSYWILTTDSLCKPRRTAGQPLKCVKVNYTFIPPFVCLKRKTLHIWSEILSQHPHFCLNV